MRYDIVFTLGIGNKDSPINSSIRISTNNKEEGWTRLKKMVDKDLITKTSN